MIKYKKKLTKVKEKKIWYFFIRFLFLPIFDFIWVNMINFHGRLLAFIYLYKRRDFYKIKKYEDAKLIIDNPEFQQIALKIKNVINDDLIYKLKEKIKLEKNNNSSQNQYANHSISFFELLPKDVKDEVIKFALLEKNIATAFVVLEPPLVVEL